jgi:hypothetical protein
MVRRWGKQDGVMMTPQTFEVMGEDMPRETRDLLAIDSMEKVERFAEQIRQFKREGYNLHITEQGLEEFVQLHREDLKHETTMHNKSLEMAPDAPMCNIGTDNLWIQDGAVRLCPYHPPIGNMVVGKLTLKEIWEAEECRRVREQTRACRRLCNISCLRRTPLRHKVQTFLRIA